MASTMSQGKDAQPAFTIFSVAKQNAPQFFSFAAKVYECVVGFYTYIHKNLRMWKCLTKQLHVPGFLPLSFPPPLNFWRVRYRMKAHIFLITHVKCYS